MASSVRVVDHGADALLRRMREGEAPVRVKVGVIGDKAAAQHESGDLTVADIASKHEFGIGVPQRSWLREYVDENTPALQRDLRSIAEAVVKRGLTLRPGLEQFGGKVQVQIQERMASGPSGWKKLSLAYVEKKGKPDRVARLIDTGQLRSSVTYAIDDGGDS